MKRLFAFLAVLFGLAILPQAAFAVPIGSPVNSAFYSIQLYGISYGPTGQTVGVHVYDQTNDAAAFGHLVITDLTASAVLLDFTSGDYGSFASPGTFDLASFVLPYGHLLQYAFNGQEFSNMKIFFGDTLVASGGSYETDEHTPVFPSYTTTETITNPIPLPAALPLLAGSLGLIGLIGWRRKQKAA